MTGPVPPRRLVSALLAALALAAAGPAGAQGRYREGRMPPRFAPPVLPDRSFQFCRLLYRSVRYEEGGRGWSTDYPYAEVNLMVRLAELTTADVSFAAPNEPNHWVVRATDPALLTCPFVMASDAGTMGLDSDEAHALREYLLKGGFLWVDDFWGTAAWEHWVGQIGQVLPPDRYRIEDVRLDDPILNTPYQLTHIPQITNIGFWRRSGGSTTSERAWDSVEPHFRAIRDPGGRIMVLMTHNTDIADAWEREGEDYGFFFRFAHDGYAVGINVLVYTMTH